MNELICESNAKKVVFLGNSAGGYAAILFGVLLQVDSVYAFSPPTLLRKKDCLMVSTVSEKVTPESWEIIEKAETSDLCSFLKKNNSDHTKIHIFLMKLVKIALMHIGLTASAISFFMFIKRGA